MHFQEHNPDLEPLARGVLLTGSHSRPAPGRIASSDWVQSVQPGLTWKDCKATYPPSQLTRQNWGRLSEGRFYGLQLCSPVPSRSPESAKHELSIYGNTVSDGHWEEHAAVFTAALGRGARK
uniref:Uncharacterized protein n=1 Tax=Myotis myotis TaxID=51298 RepID=A0A7J7Z528_MYOMY|nr:hypothetical protein mMyoMyo1_010576 [Myotis myotis]